MSQLSEYVNHSHCHRCGTVYQVAENVWPKCCLNPKCRDIIWNNPKPVANLFAFALRQNGSVGVLVVDRGIEPYGLGLPGGYMEGSESAEEAAARETYEETGFVLDKNRIKIEYTRASGHGHLMIMCTTTELIRPGDLSKFVPNSETRALQIVDPIELVFPIHTEALQNFFYHKHFKA